MKQLFILTAALFLFVTLHAQLLRATVVKGSASNSIDIWITPDNTKSTDYIYQYQFPVAFPFATSPLPSSLTVVLDGAATTAGYSVAVYPMSNSKDSTYRYFTISLTHPTTNSTPQSWTSTTAFHVLTATFLYTSAPTPPATANVSILDDQTGGADNQGQLYIYGAISGITYTDNGGVTPYNSVNDFYSMSGSATGGTSTLAFAKTTALVTLPVTLTNFTAVKANNACAVNLDWQVAQELNLKGYIVERSQSSEGINFSTIATIAASGRSNYSAVDSSPATGLNYYRLKMQDIDGKFTYSRIIPVNSNCSTAVSLSVWPNPVVGVTTVFGLTGKNKIAVIDAAGRQVASFVSTRPSQKIDMGGFNRGVYTVQIAAADGTTTNLKLVK